MKLIKRDTDYAVRALCLMSKYRPDDRVTVDDLFEDLKIPRPFLRKILQQMALGGILKSYKGMCGGFILTRSLKDIRLVDVMMIFQGPLELNKCLFKQRICPDKSTCVLRSKITALEEHVISELTSITLDSLCGGKKSA